MMFQEFVAILYSWGVVDILVPFILVFTIIFATLQRTKILGDGKKQYNVILALIMGFSVVVPHVVGMYPPNLDPVMVINNALPQVSLIVVAIIMALLIIGVFGNEIDIAGTALSGWVVVLAIISVVLIFGTQVGWFHMPMWLGFLQSQNLQASIVIILIFAVIIWFIVKEPKDTDTSKEGGKFFESIGKAMKAKK